MQPHGRLVRSCLPGASEVSGGSCKSRRSSGSSRSGTGGPPAQAHAETTHRHATEGSCRAPWRPRACPTRPPFGWAFARKSSAVQFPRRRQRRSPARRGPRSRRRHPDHVQVELAEADALFLLDADAEPLEISEFLGSGRHEDVRPDLGAGRSSVLAASDAATTLVLWRGEHEVRRIPVQPRAGEPTLLRP